MIYDKSKKYESELRVRGNELDSYGHVNNAVYLNYNEQARWELFREIGLLDKLVSDGKKIVIIENQIKYIRQARLFDDLLITTQMEKSAHFLLFHQLMINAKTKKRVAKSLVKTVFLDEQDKPCDIPEALLQLFTEE